ncbi:universal stress protein [Nostoc sp. DedQUE09]|uniref:sensor protein KdpD n=1 Tax=Nostoc sp. DedQUE09 TaxID=3075394 RepID=UPI002AD3310C|nr:universal stress protein [Nostoc sp. DedQUE09]MDZ7951695.1 universal stress protein [Nostoc sp. DedQUE09]
MIHSHTPSPDSSYIRPHRRGKHKIFIGMAPGVGKTYKMLEEAHQLKQDGIDVVIGVLETHGRKDTAMKAAGIEVVSQKACIHQNVTLQEMDTDAILQRSPQLVLVDELAHTNVPGSQREKRYQNVEVILSAGIDVYSTVNIQHLESLNDLVARITGVVVRERIPDYVLDEADAVVVIDVTPETLEERLQEGKIYAPEKIEQSLKNFFQRRNLIALRELALREVADTVEEEANTSNLVGQSCNVHERVLVCVSTYPDSVQLLRRGARIANYMNARLYTVFVADPERFLTKEESLHIDICEKLCREFGGEFLHFKSQNIAKKIAQVAIDYHITQIIIGESQQSSWKRWLKGSFTQRLMELIRHQKIDLHIIATDK